MSPVANARTYSVTPAAALLATNDPALLRPLALAGFTEPLPEADHAAMERRARAAEAAGAHDLTPFLEARPAA